MSTLQDRISELMAVTGLTVGSMADIAGVSSSAVSQWKDGPTKALKTGPATRLAERTGFSARWIANGDGPKMVSAALARPTGSLPYSASNAREVFVVGRGNGGLMPASIWTDGDYPVGATDECAEVATSDPHAFLVRVEGASMVPRYNPGEFALVEPATTPDLEDDVLVRLMDGRTMIKRLLSRRGGYLLGSYNAGETEHFDADAVTWMYYIAHPVPRRKIKSRC